MFFCNLAMIHRAEFMVLFEFILISSNAVISQRAAGLCFRDPPNTGLSATTTTEQQEQEQEQLARDS